MVPWEVIAIHIFNVGRYKQAIHDKEMTLTTLDHQSTIEAPVPNGSQKLREGEACMTGRGIQIIGRTWGAALKRKINLTRMHEQIQFLTNFGHRKGYGRMALKGWIVGQRMSGSAK